MAALTSNLRVQKEGWVAAMLAPCRAWLRSRPQRRLRLCETLPLGEKRSLAVVEFDRFRYLLGCTAGAITLLSQLPDAPQEHPAAEELLCDR